MKQQEDREVNTTDHGDRENHQHQPTEQKEKDSSVNLLMSKSGAKSITL
jgi:hypothetical protein